MHLEGQTCFRKPSSKPSKGLIDEPRRHGDLAHDAERGIDHLPPASSLHLCLLIGLLGHTSPCRQTSRDFGSGEIPSVQLSIRVAS